MIFHRKPQEPATPNEPPEPVAPRAERARISAARFTDIPAADLATAVRHEAQRLFAPTGATIFPARHEFNDFAGMVIALCDTINPDQEDQ